MIRIVAVSYFGAEDLEGLLGSLRRQDYDDWQLVVVDNSGDAKQWELLTLLQGVDSRVRILRSPRNLGYFGGAGYALKTIGLEEVDWLVVSNTDVRLADGSALGLLAEVRCGLDLGVVAPRIQTARTGRDQNPDKRTRPTAGAARRVAWALRFPPIAQVVMLLVPLKRFVARRREPLFAVGASEEVYAAHGSFMAFSRRFFDAGGSLEHPLFLFGEEVFVAEQCRALGLRTLFVPDIRVEHNEHRHTGYIRSWSMLRQSGAAAKYVYDLVRNDSRSAAPD